MLNLPSGIGWNSVTTTGPSGAPELARGSGGDNTAVIEAHVTGGPVTCSQALLPQAHQAAQVPSRHRRHASDTFASAAGQLLYGHRMPSSLPSFGPELQNTGGKSDVSLPSCPAPILEEPLIQTLHDGSLFDFLAEEGAEDARPMLDADEDLFVLPSPQAVDAILGGVGVHSIPSHSSSSAASLQQSVLAACGGRSITTALATAPPAAQTLEGSQVQKPALRAKDTHSFSARTRTKAFDPQELEPHRAQRIIANRQSAHRTRVKRMQFVFELEKQVSDARDRLSALQAKATDFGYTHRQLLCTAQQQRLKVQCLSAQVAEQMQLQAALQAELSSLDKQEALASQARQAHLPDNKHSAGLVGTALTASTSEPDQATSTDTSFGGSAALAGMPGCVQMNPGGSVLHAVEASVGLPPLDTLSPGMPHARVGGGSSMGSSASAASAYQTCPPIARVTSPSGVQPASAQSLHDLAQRPSHQAVISHRRALSSTAVFPPGPHHFPLAADQSRLDGLQQLPWSGNSFGSGLAPSSTLPTGHVVCNSLNSSQTQIAQPHSMSHSMAVGAEHMLAHTMQNATGMYGEQQMPRAGRQEGLPSFAAYGGTPLPAMSQLLPVPMLGPVQQSYGPMQDQCSFGPPFTASELPGSAQATHAYGSSGGTQPALHPVLLAHSRAQLAMQGPGSAVGSGQGPFGMSSAPSSMHHALQPQPHMHALPHGHVKHATGQHMHLHQSLARRCSAGSVVQLPAAIPCVRTAPDMLSVSEGMLQPGLLYQRAWSPNPMQHPPCAAAHAALLKQEGSQVHSGPMAWPYVDQGNACRSNLQHSSSSSLGPGLSLAATATTLPAGMAAPAPSITGMACHSPQSTPGAATAPMHPMQPSWHAGTSQQPPMHPQLSFQPTMPLGFSPFHQAATATATAAAARSGSGPATDSHGMTSLLGGANPGQQHGHGGVSMQAHASSCWPSIGAASGRVTPGVQLPAPPQAQYDVHAPYAAWAGFIGCGSGFASSSHSGLSLARLQAQPPPKPETGTQLSGEQSQQLEKSFLSSGPGLKSRGMGPVSGLAILHDSLVMPCESPLGLGDGMSSACMPLPAGFDRVSSGLLLMDDLAEVAELDLMLPGDAVFSGL